MAPGRDLVHNRPAFQPTIPSQGRPGLGQQPALACLHACVGLAIVCVRVAKASAATGLHHASFFLHSFFLSRAWALVPPTTIPSHRCTVKAEAERQAVAATCRGVVVVRALISVYGVALTPVNHRTGTHESRLRC